MPHRWNTELCDYTENGHASTLSGARNVLSVLTYAYLQLTARQATHSFVTFRTLFFVYKVEDSMTWLGVGGSAVDCTIKGVLIVSELVTIRFVSTDEVMVTDLLYGMKIVFMKYYYPVIPLKV